MLVHSLRPGEELQIGDVVVKLGKKSGQVAMLLIDAPKHVTVKMKTDQEDSKKDQKPLTTS